jgi:ABC-type branched-subunit amino acid transport system ATPase component
MSQQLLSCRRLTKRFGGLTALNEVDLDVRRGDFIGVIGPNGSGKTTFFNVLTGIFPPSSGVLQFEDQDLTKSSPQNIFRAGISRTFQRSRLFTGLSIFDNLMIGNHTKINKGAWANLIYRRALRQELEIMAKRAYDLVSMFDRKLARRMNEAVGSQSMIDSRRIEICRALISGPKLLLLDEPSAGMTSSETAQLMDNLLEVKDKIGDLSIILIEHEMNLIERVTHHCVVLNSGRKLCEGAYAQVVANPEVQTAYLGTRKRRRVDA